MGWALAARMPLHVPVLEDDGFAGPAQSQEKLSTDLDGLDAATISGFLNILRG